MRLGAGGASAKPPASSLGGGGSFFLLSRCQKGKFLHETRGGAARRRFPKAFPGSYPKGSARLLLPSPGTGAPKGAALHKSTLLTPAFHIGAV